MSTAYNQASDKIKSDLIFPSFPSKAVSPLISIGNVCLIKIKAANCMSMAFNQRSNQLKI